MQSFFCIAASARKIFRGIFCERVLSLVGSTGRITVAGLSAILDDCGSQPNHPKKEEEQRCSRDGETAPNGKGEERSTSFNGSRLLFSPTC